jgi:hypothetical protein
MKTTKQIQRADWQTYFDQLTQRLLGDEVPKAVTIELLSPRLGDQLAATVARLLGMRYDPASRAFAVLLEDRDHLVFSPVEIWVAEEDETAEFVAVLELVRSDGTRDIIYVRRSGPPALRYDDLVASLWR